MDYGATIRGIIGNMMPPPPPVPISLPQAWVDVLFHYKVERFRQWFPWVSHRWMAASFALSTALVVLGAAERAALVFIFPDRGDNSPKVPEAILTFILHIAGSLGTTFAMALGVALLMDRAYGPLRVRFREYALRPWLLAQPAICLVLLIGYPLVAWYGTLDPFSSTLPGFIDITIYFLMLIPFSYSLTLSQGAFSAGSGQDSARIFYRVLLPIGAIFFFLTWILPEYVASRLG